MNDLIRQLTAELEHDPRINLHRGPIHAHLQEGHLVLEGTAEHIVAKRCAVAAAYRLSGALPVLDRVRVAPGEHKEDQALRDAVINAFSGESALNEYRLRTEVSDHVVTVRDPAPRTGDIKASIHEGVVTLSGKVGSLSHRRLAEVLVWWTGGCELVQNHLEVVPPEQDHDGEITDAIRIVLEKDPLIHASQLTVTTRSGVVTLNGYLASTQERDLAVRDAWYVPGVLDVVDQISAAT